MKSLANGVTEWEGALDLGLELIIITSFSLHKWRIKLCLSFRKLLFGKKKDWFSFIILLKNPGGKKMAYFGIYTSNSLPHLRNLQSSHCLWTLLSPLTHALNYSNCYGLNVSLQNSCSRSNSQDDYIWRQGL